jgi:gamma-glutamyltranspeptidase / glutathione hydrolase
MIKFKKIICISTLCIHSFITNAQLNPYNYNNTKNIQVKKAAVVSAHALASDIGIQMIQLGGNAFDAAIATQLALAVVYPSAGNLGGGGFLVAHTKAGKNIALDFREMAPANASRDMYLDSLGNPITDLSTEGYLASGVPGTVAGLYATLPYAKLPMATLITPAINLAEKGFALTAAQASSFNDMKETFVRLNKNPIAFVKDSPWKAGDILIQTDLANTLKRIRDNGAKGFYEGETAALIVKEMSSGNGIITTQDLKNYKAHVREAMQFPYKNYKVISMPLPSSGGIILQQLLQMTTDYKLSNFPFHSPSSVHLIVEAERRAYADRAEFLGDPDFVKVPIKKLISKAYLQKRMVDYNPLKAGNSKLTKAGIIKESEETTHISILDNEGNAIAITITLNDNYGNKTIVTGAGFIMNNEMNDFSAKPGVPNMYGALGNDKNAITPGKRMLSSMTPTIVLKNNKPHIILGTPGGTTIPTSVFQSIVNIIDYNLSPADAVNKPKFHHQWLPDVIFVEKNFPKKVRNELIAMGYTIKERKDIGCVDLIKIDNKKITAIADKRGDDDARGF